LIYNERYPGRIDLAAEAIRPGRLARFADAPTSRRCMGCWR
jgi:hypothetical protein